MHAFSVLNFICSTSLFYSSFVIIYKLKKKYFSKALARVEGVGPLRSDASHKKLLFITFSF